MEWAKPFKDYVESKTGLTYSQAHARLLGPTLAAMWRDFARRL